MRFSELETILAALQTDGVNLGLHELVRYQSQTKLLDLSPKLTPQARLAGTYITKHKGRGMEFDEARHYQPGDDIRAIDWRVTARTGKTHTKVYREERERPVFILCDLSKSMQFGTRLLLKSVQAAHLASLTAWSAAKRGDKVGALIFNDDHHQECKPLASKKSVLNICHELTTIHDRPVSESNDRCFSQALGRLRRLARPGSLVYIISDFQKMDDLAEQHLANISKHCEVHSHIIADPLERDLPESSVIQPVTVTDGKEKQTWLLGDRNQAKHYRQTQARLYAHIEKTLGKNRSSYHYLSAGAPLKQQLETARGLVS